MIMIKSLLSYIPPPLFVLEVALPIIFPGLVPGSAGSGFLGVFFFLICVPTLVFYWKVLALTVISPPVLAASFSSVVVPLSPTRITFDLGGGCIVKLGQFLVFDIEGLVYRLYS